MRYYENIFCCIYIRKRDACIIQDEARHFDQCRDHPTTLEKVKKEKYFAHNLLIMCNYYLSFRQ